jgi:hypothetical protein
MIEVEKRTKRNFGDDFDEELVGGVKGDPWVEK